MHQIIWGGGHGLDRADLRNKPPEQVEEVIRTSMFQTDKGKGRWEILGCIGGFMSLVAVQVIGPETLIVVTVFGEGNRCR
jgi:hypothetical protein